MVISIDIKPILSQPKSYLASAIAASATSLTLLNNAGLATNDYVITGALGDELSEIAAISGTTSNTGITTGAVKFAHPSNTVVQKILYNQIKVEKSTDSGSTWSVVQTINITGDQEYHDYVIDGALSTDIYRTRFYNSTSAIYSPYSNEIVASGSVVETIINSIFSKLKIDESGDEQVKPDDIFNLIAEADLEIVREIVRLNPNYFTAPLSLDITNGTTEYALPSTFLRASRVMLKYRTTDTAVESVEVDESFGDGLDDNALSYCHFIKYSYADRSYFINLKRTPTEDCTAGITGTYVKRIIRIYQTSDDLNLPNSDLFVDVLEKRVLQKIFQFYKNNGSLSEQMRQEYELGLQSIRQIIGMSDWSNEGFVQSADVERIFNPYGTF